MAFYIKTDGGVTGGGGDYYVGEGLPGHWGIKAEGTTQALGAIKANANRYYRRVAVKNLM